MSTRSRKLIKKKRDLLFFWCLKNNICSGNNSKPLDEDLTDLNSQKEKADQRITCRPNKKQISGTCFLGKVEKMLF
jgi:hypothetical protein